MKYLLCVLQVMAALCAMESLQMLRGTRKGSEDTGGCACCTSAPAKRLAEQQSWQILL